MNLPPVWESSATHAAVEGLRDQICPCWDLNVKISSVVLEIFHEGLFERRQSFRLCGKVEYLCSPLQCRGALVVLKYLQSCRHV